MFSSTLRSINQIFEAGIAITAFSLFIRALTFNLHDRVSRSFAIVLACVMVVFSGEAISGSVSSASTITFWLQFQWIGIVFFPAAFVHFSDALLETTGRPSRGRRKILVRVFYVLSTAFLACMPFGYLVGSIIMDQGPVPHLSRTAISVVFTFYYILTSIFSCWMIWRAYQRTRLSQSRRRMRYLMSGAFILVIGTYPYLLISSSFAYHHPTSFIGLATLGNVLVFVFLVLMAYAVAYFGIQWPDRLVKSRLVKWLLRGPITVFIVLLFMTAAQHAGRILGTSYTVSIPIVTAFAVLLIEHTITLTYPFIERWIFVGGDHQDLQLLQEVSDRLVTSTDLHEFLEAVLASVCDRFQVSTGFVAGFSDQKIEYVVRVGNLNLIPESGIDNTLLGRASNDQEDIFSWGDFWLVPLYSQQQEELLGLMGVLRRDDDMLDEELSQALLLLGQRAALVLDDRRLQRQVFQALESLNPKMNMIQQLRAATRYDQDSLLSELDQTSLTDDISRWVKDALSHYWGGPKLTESPLQRLHIVQEALDEHDGNTANALRAILKQGIESVKPDGERRFTAEWILYNILDLKFMQGRKVREIALRLAMSEADLYRKQRVAIEEVAKALVDMEREVIEEVNGGSL